MRTRRRAARYDTMMCGADSSTARVAMIVNRVKIIRHSLSTTMAANFQSRETSASSSSLRICNRSALLAADPASFPSPHRKHRNLHK